MNPGRKLVRNTVIGLWTATALFVGLNRLNASAAEGEGFRFGLRHQERAESVPPIDLASATGFTGISVRGPLEVRVVGAPAYRVSLEGSSADAPDVRAFLQEGTLHVDAGDSKGEVRAILRVEVPSLERIDSGAARILIQGLGAPEVSVRTYNGGVVRLERNQVQRWEFFSGDPLAVQVDDATFAAGAFVSRGDVSIGRAP